MNKKNLHGLLIGISISVFLIFLFQIGFFSSWQERLSDSMFLPHPPNSNIAIIAIDDRSIHSIGRWPWDRSVHAKIINYLGDMPAAIGYDVSFLEPSTTADDDALANAIAKSNRTILAGEAQNLHSVQGILNTDNLLLPIQKLIAPVGIVNMLADDDGIARRTPIRISFNNNILDNFSVQILKSFYKNTSSTTSKLDELARIPTKNGYMRINFAGRPGTYRTYSFVDVLNGKIPAKEFQNKIVLIGATAINLHDVQFVPVSSGTPMSGVELHANVLQTIMEQRFLKRDPSEIIIASIILLALISSFLFTNTSILVGTGIFVLALVVYLFYAILSFDQGNVRDVIFGPLALSFSYISQVIYKYTVESNQKRFIRKAFSFYVSGAVMKELLDNPKKLRLGGERKIITVLFSDIAGFTSISEKIPPETLAILLNHYLTRMTQIVFSNKGVLDKFIGDAVMAFWGAPIEEKNQALLACEAALEMQKNIQEIKKEWAEMSINDFDVRIGVHTGEMIVGNMGSDMRFDYTLIGDNVNLGSRLEGINKEYGTHIMISGSTYEHVKDKVIVRRIDTVAVKGKAHGVTIYELRGMGKPSKDESLFIEKFEQARHWYHEGDFKQSLMLFEDLKKEYPHDKVIKVYIDRCTEFVKNPPTTWDGVYHATSK